jgi:iron(III) transport system permease protein
VTGGGCDALSPPPPSTAVEAASAGRRSFSLELPAVACTVVLLAVAFCVVYPLLLVVIASFQVAPPGQPAQYGLDGWRAAFAEPLLRAALVNTLKVTVARQVVSWRSRSDRVADRAYGPAREQPDRVRILGRVLPADPHGHPELDPAARSGLRPRQPPPGRLGLVARGPFDIYSFWGIVWIHVITGSLTVKVILLTPAFRNMNAAFERPRGWRRVHGAHAIAITVPSWRRRALGAPARHHGVPADLRGGAVLGVPFRFFVFSTMIYDLLVTRVPRYDAATALSVIVLAAMLPLVVTQQWLTRGRRYTTVTASSRTRRTARGPGAGRRSRSCSAAPSCSACPWSSRCSARS